MNIYDFDNTIINGDSSKLFIWYSILRHPLLVIGSAFKAFWELIKWMFHKSNLGMVKSKMFSFVKKINDIDNYVDRFVLKYQDRIKKFYLDNKKDNDIIISASFLFIVKPFCKKIGIKHVIATNYDVKCGKIIGVNCKGEEKIRRLKEEFPQIKVKKAFSDSLSDLPMFKVAEQGYLVKKDKLIIYKDK